MTHLYSSSFSHKINKKQFDNIFVSFLKIPQKCSYSLITSCILINSLFEFWLTLLFILNHHKKLSVKSVHFKIKFNLSLLGIGFLRPCDCFKPDEGYIISDRLRDINQETNTQFFTNEEQKHLLDDFSRLSKNKPYLPGSFVFKAKS